MDLGRAVDLVFAATDGGDPFFRQIQDVYDEIGEGMRPDVPWPRPGQIEDQHAEIGASGLFDVVRIRQFDWEQVYDAESDIELPDTFSGHIAMQDWQRARSSARSDAGWPVGRTGRPAGTLERYSSSPP